LVVLILVVLPGVRMSEKGERTVVVVEPGVVRPTTVLSCFHRAVRKDEVAR